MDTYPRCPDRDHPISGCVVMSHRRASRIIA